MRTETYSAACPSEGGGDIEAKQLNPEPALLEGKQPHATLSSPSLPHRHLVKLIWKEEGESVVPDCWAIPGFQGLFRDSGPYCHSHSFEGMEFWYQGDLVTEKIHSSLLNKRYS